MHRQGPKSATPCEGSSLSAACLLTSRFGGNRVRTNALIPRVKA
jgi:hypothetical protein